VLATRGLTGAWSVCGVDAVILACNGFGGHPELVKQLLPEMATALYAGHAGNDGSAIQWARQLGVRTADLGGYQGHGSWAIPQGALITWALMTEGGVQVNAQGRRFHDETQGYSESAVQVLAQPDGVAWDVFDTPLLELAQTFPDFCDAETGRSGENLRRYRRVGAAHRLRSRTLDPDAAGHSTGDLCAHRTGVSASAEGVLFMRFA